MISVRHVLFAIAAIALSAPASALAQGPHQAQSGAPCWVDPQAVKCLRDKLDKDVAQHQIGPHRAEQLRHRLHEAKRLDDQLRETLRQLDVDIPEPK
jgi:hypothetical protein